MKVLVTGGVRSGKSAHAESLVGALDGEVTYVAAGPSYDDADWSARIARHRAARPAHWRTLETRDLVGVLDRARGPVLIDCLGTWLQGLLDEADAWDAASEELDELVERECDAVVGALGAVSVATVLVTNEVGLGVVPDHRSGRVFRDLLGTVNQRVGAACDVVHLVVAGRVLEI